MPADPTAAEVIKTEIEVTHNGITYLFKIPSVHEEIKIGIKSREIRRRIVGDTGDAADYGLDFNTQVLIRSCAIFELLLKKCTDKWPYSAGEGGLPVVVSDKFPPEHVDTVVEVGLAFSNQIDTFRAERSAAGKPATEKAVAGQPDPVDKPV